MSRIAAARAPLMRIAAGAVLIACLGFFAWGWFEGRHADDEAPQVRRELAAQYRPGAGRPAAAALRLNLFDPFTYPEPKLPEVDGIGVRTQSLDGDTVHLVFQGEDRASLWCFTVDYQGDDVPSVSAAPSCGR